MTLASPQTKLNIHKVLSQRLSHLALSRLNTFDLLSEDEKQMLYKLNKENELIERHKHGLNADGNSDNINYNNFNLVKLLEIMNNSESSTFFTGDTAQSKASNFFSSFWKSSSVYDNDYNKNNKQVSIDDEFTSFELKCF